MKYLCLVYLDEKRLDEVPDAEFCTACGRSSDELFPNPKESMRRVT